MQAISVKWPYIAYSGIEKKFLNVFNLFDKNSMHRIKIHEKSMVIATYITETNDLFVLSQINDLYKLQFIDLDASNKWEQDSEKIQNLYDQYRLQDLFEYHSSEVNEKPLLKIHVRGSSRKEVIDVNERLIVILLHTDTLYKIVIPNKNKNRVEKELIQNLEGKDKME